ncbi:MAG: hypothetical protein OXU48_02190 [candidate division Zixibacteria bacterium]|nr:hypothetical protein [candidate division Zixibacteria bacterium]
MSGPEDNVVILFRGGRLPEWHRLDQAQRIDYERRHVDLMLSVADRHGLIGIHGYRLLGPRGSWERFWTIEFPDLAGAEAWMSAEADPPYGRYGYYDYTLARRWQPECLNWLPRKAEPPLSPGTDPHIIPALSSDPSSIVLLAFGGRHRGAESEENGDQRDSGDQDEERMRRMRNVSRDHDLIHGEVFRLLGTTERGDYAWILEFPGLAGIEAWIDEETAPPLAAVQRHDFHVARRWAPEYFAAWAAGRGG